MAMPTIEEVKKAKRQLEIDILGGIKRLEHDFGVSVKSVDILCVSTMTSQETSVINAEIKLSI